MAKKPLFKAVLNAVLFFVTAFLVLHSHAGSHSLELGHEEQICAAADSSQDALCATTSHGEDSHSEAHHDHAHCFNACHCSVEVPVRSVEFFVRLIPQDLFILTLSKVETDVSLGMFRPPRNA